MTPLTEIPLHLPGRVYRSPMPYSRYDQPGELLDQYQRNGVDVVVQLVSDEEALSRSQRELRELYGRRGLEVIYLPMPDFGAPAMDQLTPAVEAALEKAASGRNLAVHCHAGIGRTGLFLACMARRALGLGGLEAVHWVRQYIPDALEVQEQVNMAIDFA